MTTRRYAFAAAAALLVVFLSLLPAVSQDEYSVFPPDAFPNPRRPVSLFTHEDHMVFDTIEDCYACHHLYVEGRLVEGESSDGTPCGECHGLEPGGGGTDLLRAYHGRCKGCHEEEQAGPIACGECHSRK
ncbi:MAG: acidic tetraheme cytochrome c3 TmcA [Thermodesulfobacteriota bacterium]